MGDSYIACDSNMFKYFILVAQENDGLEDHEEMLTPYLETKDIEKDLLYF